MRIKWGFKGLEIEVEDADPNRTRETFADLVNSIAEATDSPLEKKVYGTMSKTLKT